MDPSRGEDGADALRNYREFGHVHAVGFMDVTDEFVQIRGKRGHCHARILFALAFAVGSGVPGEDGEFGKVQFPGDVGEAAGMFMAAVAQNDGFFSDPGQYR